ncbi:MAG TPA: D-aminoacylase [Steroidobacteraceae bacterium]|nr:D-aminoacylase [Steroidobacteraceae bacterium]
MRHARFARAALAGMLAAALAGCAPEPVSSTLIVNASIVDGTGSPARAGAVRIDGDRIVEVGDLEPKRGEQVVDAGGHVLAPGFIDVHSHHEEGLFEMRDATPVVSQGITTIVAGQDGSMTYPVRELFERMEATPVAVNVATYVGHGTLRTGAMGKDDYRRHATPEEVERMRQGVADGMAAGALGLATGLEYDPGIYSATEEVVTLAQEAAKTGGRYISHVRSEDREFWAAIDEIVRIGREAKIPVEVTHMKLAMKDWWGQSARLLGILDKARAEGVDVTGDIYPYEYWHSDLTVLFPKRDFKDRKVAQFVLDHVTPADGIILTDYSPEPALVGKSLAEIAAAKKTDPAVELMDLIARSQGENASQSIMGRGMIEQDIDALIVWPYAAICSDGSLDSMHPRGRGAFTKVLREYVRERKLLTLEEAVRKMTGLSAANVGIADRGAIRPGAYADLVMFDPATVADRSTFEDPKALSVGIDRVWVNGVAVWQDGKSTGAFPGRGVKRP